MLSLKRMIFSMALAGSLAGCGTYAPHVADIPGGDDGLLIKAIQDSIHCEIKNSVQAIISQDLELAKNINNGQRSVAWLDDWGVAGLLTLTISEKTELNPTGDWMPSKIFTLGAGLDASTQAQTTQKTNFFYRIRDLAYKEQPCAVGNGVYVQVGPHPPGSLLINSDLGFRNWLATQAFVAGTGAAPITKDKQALVYDIQFEIVTSANVTPMWTLVRAKVNTGGTFLSAKRDRTHDLSLTLGPADPTTSTLTGVAGQQFLAEQIGSSIRNSVTTSLTAMSP